MSLKVMMFHGEKSATLEIAKPNNAQVIEIIHGVFSVFGVVVPRSQHVFNEKVGAKGEVIKSSQPKPTVERKDLSAEPKMPVGVEVKIDTPEREAIKWSEVTEKISKQLPFVNAERTLNTAIGEKLGPLLAGLQKDDENPTPPTLESPAPRADDVQLINGLEHYRTRVYCKNVACSKQSNRWVPLKQLSIQCPHCKTIHVRRDATPQGFPTQDQHGNYFKADRLWINHYRSNQERAKSPIQ